MSKSASPGARSRARDLVVQALYQMQIAGHDEAELTEQFHERPDYQRVDKGYFDEVLAGNWPTGTCPPLWDGKTAGRAVEFLRLRTPA